MLLMISLDSENAEWLREHMANGNLPNLAALARSGAIQEVKAALLAGTAYPTLYTGARAADLGCYFPLQWDAGAQRVAAWDQPAWPQTLFERLDRAGKRIVVLDPPESQPVAIGKGLIVAGVQFRSRVLLSPWSSDEARSEKLMRRLGPAPRADEVFGPVSQADLRYLRSVLLHAPARLTTAALDFIRHDPPDCLWLTCCGLHVAGHQFFHLPSIGNAALRRELEGTRLELARGYDRMLGSLMAALPPGSDVLVSYAKGMGRITQWSDLLPEMLRRILQQTDGDQPASLLRRLIPRRLRRWAALSMDDRRALELMARLSNPRADWTRTRAFCLPTDCLGFIRLNVAGRERDGIVNMSGFEELKQEISAGLKTFTCAGGEPCVDGVYSPAELFGTGRNLHLFPDLIVTWRQRSGQLSHSLRSAQFGEIRRKADVVGRSGNHCPGAFAIFSEAARETVRRDRSMAGEVMRVEDIPATLLDGLGVPADDLPGRSFWGRQVAGAAV
jgi:predicted AlkP superfamily phosphohydrolase/phosphomutase